MTRISLKKIGSTNLACLLNPNFMQKIWLNMPIPKNDVTGGWTDGRTDGQSNWIHGTLRQSRGYNKRWEEHTYTLHVKAPWARMNENKWISKTNELGATPSCKTKSKRLLLILHNPEKQSHWPSGIRCIIYKTYERFSSKQIENYFDKISLWIEKMLPNSNLFTTDERNLEKIIWLRWSFLVSPIKCLH